MKILVIGGTSFIGPHVVRRLVEAGHLVTVFHRGQTEAELPSEVRRIKGDRKNLSAFATEFKSIAPDVVLDMILFTEEDARNLVSTFRGVASRVVMPSSMDVYRNYGRLHGLEQGEPDLVPYSEEGPLRETLYPYRKRAKGPEDSAYHYEKILAERIVMSDDNLPATILRLPAVYGPRDKQHRLYEYLKRMDDRRPFILMEETRARWLWTRGFVENVAHAIALAVMDERSVGHIYNVGEEETLTEADWVRTVGRAVGWNGEVLVLDKASMPENYDHYPFEYHVASDSSRIRRELGYKEPVSREEALLRTVAWERENPPAEVNPSDFDYASEDAALSKLKEHGVA